MKPLLPSLGIVGVVSALVAQPAWAQVAQVTAVQLKPTPNGLEILLQTTGGAFTLVQSTPSPQGFTAEIRNAQLRLPQGNAFRVNNPTEGITSVTVAPLDNNRIQVVATGRAGVPTGQVFLRGTQGLVVSLTTPPTTAEQIAPPSTPAAQPSPSAEELNQSEEPIELVVTAERDADGYRVPSATTGTRTATPLRDIPQSIQVVPEQVIEDQQVTRVGDVLQNVSGVTNRGSYGGYEDLISIRGFGVSTFQGSYYRDGIRSFTFGFPETTNLEQIEVLKGPASVLFGQAEPGGIINLVTKQPLSEPYYSLETTVGNYETYRGSFDLSGPLNDSKTLRYRTNGLYDSSGSFRDFVKSERYFIAPALTWEIGSNTALRIDGEFLDDSRTMDDGIPVIGDRPADIPRSRFLSEPFSNFEKQEYNIGYVFDHRFSDSWSVRNAFRAQSVRPERYYPSSSSLDETTGELSRTAYWAGGKYNYYSTQTDLIGRFLTGPIQHQLLLGFEYVKGYEAPEFRIGIDYPSINIFNPVYTRERYPKEPNFFRDDTTRTLGFYLQDQIAVLPNLKLLLGGRFDNYHQNRSEQNLGEPRQEFEQSDSAFSPRAGIVYQPSEALSLYASYTSSFRPSFGTSRNPDQSAFEPETATQYEIGVKGDFLDNRLSATLAAFNLKKQNVVTADPNNPDFSIQTGEQTSRGIELDVTGEILPGWRVIASAAYLDAFISEDNTLEVGNRLDNVPKFTSSLWTTYEIQKGNLQGLGLGLGLLYTGDRQGDLDNSYLLPSYLRTDGAIYYRRNNWRAALNLKNLLNVEYFAGSDGGRTGVQPGAPLTIQGTVSLEF